MKISLINLWFVLSFISICFVACTEDTQVKDKLPEETTVAASEVAKSKFDIAIKEAPDNHTLYFKRALYYYDLEGYDQAIDDLKKAIAIDSSYLNYHHLLADVYMDYYKSKPALTTLRTAAAQFPDSINTLLKLSEFEFILKQNDESIKTCDRILRKDGQNAEAYYMLGRNFKARNETKRAINSFQTCVENDPDHIDAYFELGNLFDQQKNPIAEKYYDNALRIAPDNVGVIFAKANHYHNTDKLNKAIELYKKAVVLDSQYADAYYNIGLAYLEMDSIKLGYDHFNLTVNTSPTYIMGYFYRGYASEAMGKLNDAKADYEKVLNFAPDFTRGIDALENINNKLNKK